MKFKEYLYNLNKYAKENPESLEFDVITSSDDEGNAYYLVNNKPSEGVFEHGYFMTEKDLKKCNKSDINAICVN